jgi:ABC-type sugar transport system ATPase subunit
MTSTAQLLELRNIHKRFGNTYALRGVDFDVRAGEAHALLGENGSGKSTLMKIAYGELQASAGEVLIGGTRAHLANPHQATKAGVAMVPQEIPVVASVTVGENILLGRLPMRGGAVRWREVHRRAKAILTELDSPLDPRRKVSTLGPDDRQIVAIARALAVHANVMIFDEPTSSLTAERVESLFRIVRRLKERGTGIVFISQRLQDVQQVADRVTVIRDGGVVGCIDVAEADEATITRMMVGRSLTDYFHSAAAGNRDLGRSEAPPALVVRSLSVPGQVHQVSLSVRPGEVVGLAGLVGCGRVDLLRSIFGVAPRVGGSIEVNGRRLSRTGARPAVAAGLALVTGDRKAEGLVLSRSVMHNLTMVHSNRLSLAPVSDRKQRQLAERLIREIQIRPADPSVPVAKLSGGNQQKVALGRWLARTPTVLLLDEPTRGIDVGAKSEIYRVIRELARQGVATVISSSENAELLGICDRILMMFKGRVVAEGWSTELDEWKVAEHVAGLHA